MNSSLIEIAESGSLSGATLVHGLGPEIASLVARIADFARQKNVAIYFVGGGVRDMLLGCATQDLDFALDADAATFADDLARSFGGLVQAYRPFGTATWTLDPAATERLSLPRGLHIDFARARSESYAAPATLPQVQPGDIVADMRRRDFSINAMALALGGSGTECRLVDPCGGLADLKAGRIRVLHDLSFRDDPTRILRAWRLAVRLQFDLDPHSLALMRAALPWLSQTTGARLRNEFELLLRDREPGPTLAHLQRIGALPHIHPGFEINAESLDRLQRFHDDTVEKTPVPQHALTIGWCLILAPTGEANARAICERLELTKALTQAICASATLCGIAQDLDNPETPLSAFVPRLDKMPDDAIDAGLLLLADKSAAVARLSAYRDRWRELRPSVTGRDLMALGLAPGPRYRELLDRLRFAWIDGDINTAAQERELLQQMLNGDA